jgi:hypothetical protein
MLLIAQPKSASTSLVSTIGKIGGKRVNLGISKKPHNKDCEGFSEIQKYHCNMVQRNEQFLRNTTTNRSIVYKEHLLPIREHMEVLEKLKQRIVILIRNPEDSFDSYRRFFEENNPKKEVNNDRLLNDLWNFHNYWMHWASNKPYAICVEYRDLVLNFQYEIQRILKYFGLKVPKNIKKIKLAKIKYTGVGVKRFEKMQEVQITK